MSISNKIGDYLFREEEEEEEQLEQERDGFNIHAWYYYCCLDKRGSISRFVRRSNGGCDIESSMTSDQARETEEEEEEETPLRQSMLYN